jgi:hypothetical protein
MEYKKITEIEREELTQGFTADKDCWKNPIIKNIKEFENE